MSASKELKFLVAFTFAVFLITLNFFVSPQQQDVQQQKSGNQLARNGSFLKIQVTAIHVDDSEFPLNKLLFKLTLKLALQAASKQLEQRRVRLAVSVRSANTCSRQYASALAAEEYYTKRARLFFVSGCDAAIRGVSRLASQWRVPIMTAAGFGADLDDKSVHKTLIRVAFSLRAAVEFLFRIMRSHRWRRFNLIVDESDANSLALKGSIQMYLAEHEKMTMNETQSKNFDMNIITLNLQTLINLQPGGSGGSSNVTNVTSPVTSAAKPSQAINGWLLSGDRWPNKLTENAINDALRQSSLFSRVNILLVPQALMRKFMLSVYDQNMANGMYTFINMPLLLNANDDQLDADDGAKPGDNSNNYVTSTGDNMFAWRSSGSTRNLQAKQAYESVMSIYLRVPTNKAFVYFSSRMLDLANSEHMNNVSKSKHNQQELYHMSSTRIQLNTNIYSASFYDCLQIYAIALNESLNLISNSHVALKQQKQHQLDLHARISDLVRNRKFENMVTGTVRINANGDRETDYTLDDMNQMTGKFAPVMLYRSETRELERVGKIHWSSEASVGPTSDTVDCNLIGTCASKPISRFLVALMLIATPLSLLLSSVLYIVHQRLSLESQLVDYWWRIHMSEVEPVITRRKNANDGSLVNTSAGPQTGSVVSSQGGKSSKFFESGTGVDGKSGRIPGGHSMIDTTVTRATGTSAAPSTAVDVCYGNISMGIYKLSKVALKPIGKFRHSRKLMIELRTMKGINHGNLCRFVGIVVDEGSTALVNEFCPKGSLREFFHNESMVIDWTFKYSIINDIIAGLLYLHSSDLGYHGRLKSSNCLVSSRFVVKLCDYGLCSIYDQIDEDEQDNLDWLRKRIWLAPEHMKSNSSKVGSMKGDVYSFGLLLYEIITNNLPFFDIEQNDYVMPLKSLYNELKNNGPSEKLGIDLVALEQAGTGADNGENNIKPLIELMQSCWHHEASKRPTSSSVGTAIKKITRGITSRKLLENLTSRMEQYTDNLELLVDAKLATLVEEKLRTEELLYQFVPKSIASLLKAGQSIEPEAFECVTVFYSDIVGFTSLSSESTPMEVVDLLSDLYLCFDETLEQHDIFKIDTVGDAYIVASGLPQLNENKHAVEIANAALELRERLKQFRIPHKPDQRLEMRVGIHSGPCIAGIVGGMDMPKYCVFGDTLTTGKFMESSGLPMKIHITEESKQLLAQIQGLAIEPRTPRISKDGLPFQTYWLERDQY